MKTLAFSLFLLLAFCFGISNANAASFLVTKPADTNDGVCNADCSLREAVQAANSQAGDDAIDFVPVAFPPGQNLTLISGELIILNNGALTITGPRGVRLRISGNNQSRIFYIADRAQATIFGLTLADGNGVGAESSGLGGAIFNNGGILTLINAVVRDNTTRDGNGAGINNNGGKLTVSHTAVNNNITSKDGGGIFNFGEDSLLTVVNSVIYNNSASSGAGIYSFGALQLTNSTVTDNAANLFGGGILVDGLFGGAATLINATVSHNRAGSAGGGVGNKSGTISARNTIFADNISATGSAPDFEGALNSLGNNLIENTSGASITGETNGNVTGRDPLLSALASNGGPTLTHALLAGSPAIDAGNDCVAAGAATPLCAETPLITDQRGAFFSRRAGANVDIGAFEVQAPIALTGQVLTGISRKPISNAVVKFTDSVTGETFTAVTNPFGYYRFNNLRAGQQYIVEARHKRYFFPVRTLGFFGETVTFNIFALEFSQPGQ